MRQQSLLDDFVEPSSALLEILRALPKIELHAHLSGCLRATTVAELAHRLAVTSQAREDVLDAVILGQPASSFEASFLPWRRVLNRISELPELSERLMYEVAEDFAHDGVRYAEVRVATRVPPRRPDVRATLEGLQAGALRAKDDFGIDVRVILGITRHHFLHLDLKTQTEFVDLVLDEAEPFRGNFIVGFDLWGRELGNPPQLFRDVFRRIRERGYSLTIHAGEVGSPENIREAIEVLGAERIGHGRLAVRSSTMTDLLQASGVMVEACLSSNELTGIERDLHAHPLKTLVERGVQTTLCSDNTLVYGTNLSREFGRALVAGLISPDDVAPMLARAADAAFAAPADKVALVREVKAAVPGNLSDQLRARL